MQELRLVGVHEDGRHLLLSAADGTRFKVALNDDLRVASRGRRSGVGAGMPAPSSAREVQALVRSGLSVEEVAERAGWPISKVTVFAAPVLAERGHVAGRAAAVRLRSEDGEAERLSTRVERRLAGRGVDPDEVDWDAARDDAGVWHVHIEFVAGGRERRAVWRFDTATEHVNAMDDEARWLSEDDDQGARVQPHRFGGEQVFDVEKTGGVVGEDDQLLIVPAPPAPRGDPTDALMTAIREHSHAGERGGRRRSRSARAKVAPVKAVPVKAMAAASEAEPVQAVPTEAVTVEAAPVPAASAEGAEAVEAVNAAETVDTAVPEAATTGVASSEADTSEASPGEPAPAEVAEAETTPADVTGGADVSESDRPVAAEAEPRLVGADELPFEDFDSDADELDATAAATPPRADGPDLAAAPSEPVLETRASRRAAAEAAGVVPEEGVDFPDSDEIPPPARGIHPNDRLPDEPLADEEEDDGIPPARGEAEAEAESATSEAEPSQAQAPEESPAANLEVAADAPTPDAPKSGPAASKRKGRVGVPSWNDVMFGPPRGATEKD